MLFEKHQKCNLTNAGEEQYSEIEKDETWQITWSVIWRFCLAWWELLLLNLSNFKCTWRQGFPTLEIKSSEKDEYEYFGVTPFSHEIFIHNVAIKIYYNIFDIYSHRFQLAKVSPWKNAVQSKLCSCKRIPWLVQ